MKKTWVVASVLALAPLALLAANDGGHHRHGRGIDALKMWDANSDGVVTKDEAQAASAERTAKRFDAMDLNKDGQITQEEVQQGREQRHAAMKQKLDESFKAADKNGDGGLSKEESQSMPRIAQRFDALDANKDGVVTQEELQARHEKMREKKSSRS
jgi:Ca2+-binding EF-hand superfamily protein